jgi:hypothetical protein
MVDNGASTRNSKCNSNTLERFYNTIGVAEKFWPVLKRESGIASIESLVLFVTLKRDVKNPVTENVQRRLVAGVMYLITRRKHNAEPLREVAERVTKSDWQSYALQTFPIRDISETAKIVKQPKRGYFNLPDQRLKKFVILIQPSSNKHNDDAISTCDSKFINSVQELWKFRQETKDFVLTTTQGAGTIAVTFHALRSLYKHQRIGVAFALTKYMMPASDGLLLADEMGLGIFTSCIT